MSAKDDAIERGMRDTRTAARFWAKAQKADGCWTWTAGKCVGDYGAFAVCRPTAERTTAVLAHRMAWAIANQTSPRGSAVCHHCDNPRCVRPEHLFIGTRTDNNRDRNAKGRQSRGVSRPAAKLNDHAVRAIRRMAEAVPVSTIAAWFDMNDQTIALVVKRVTWKHVT